MRTWFGLIVVLGFVLAPGQAHALKGGLLDPGFGVGGIARVSASPEGARESARAMAIDPEGRIVVAGDVTDTAGDDGWVLARFDANGGVDLGFGTNGVAREAPLFGPGVTGDPSAIAFEPGSGKILVGGSFSGDFAVARYNTNGSLDTTFGPADTGFVQADLGSLADTLQDLAVMPDGRITATGSKLPDAAFVRWNSDGVLDPTFDGPLGTGDGKFTDFVTAGSDDYRDLEVDPSGAIRAVGISSGPGPDASSWLIARYTPTGARDMTFGDNNDGVQEVLSRFAQAQVLIGDLLYVMGSADTDPGPATESDPALIAVNASTGAPVPGSQLILDLDEGVNVFNGTLQRLNGSSDPAAERLVLAGLGGAAARAPAFLLRLRRVAGDPVAFEPDPDFGSGGILLLPNEGDPLQHGLWAEVATDGQQRLIAGGHLGDNETADFTAARLVEEQPQSETPDTTAPGGTVRILTRSLRALRKSRRLRVRLTIDEAGSYDLRARAKRRRSSLSLGRLTPEFDSGGGRRVAFKLSRRKLRALRGRRKARVTLRFTRRDLAGNTASGTRSKVLKSRRPGRRVRQNRV